MRICIINLTGGGISAGYLKYLQNIVPRIRDDRRVRALDVYAPPQIAPELSVSIGNIRTWPPMPRWKITGHLRAEIAALRPDVVFLPNLIWMDCGSVPIVVMPQNMEPLAAPIGNNPPLLAGKNLLRALMGRAGCRRATRVIAISRFVREFLIESWRLDPRKIGLVYFGVDGGPVHIGRTDPPGQIAYLSQRPFFMTAGSIRPYRGLEDLIKALASDSLMDSGIRILICGGSDHETRHYMNRMKALSEKFGVGDRIVWAGHLDRQSLTWCYGNCAAFIMTSRVEACPNTALEALSHGCQIVSTSNPPMAEFFEDAALYYTAGSTNQLAARLVEVLARSEPLRLDAGVRARSMAARFSWDTAARRTVSELEQAIGMHEPS